MYKVHSGRPIAITAKFNSKCESLNGHFVLCDGVKAGDEVLYSKLCAAFAYKGVVGHLACRIADFEKKEVAPLVKILQQHQSDSPGNMPSWVIEKIAQDLRDKWLNSNAPKGGK